MYRRLRIDVVNGGANIVFIDDFLRYFSVEHFLKQSFHTFKTKLLPPPFANEKDFSLLMLI